MTQTAKRGGKRANGEGTISKRKTAGKVTGWKGSLTIGTKPDGTLDRRWVSGKTQEEVREKMTALRSEQHTGMLADAEGLTVASYMLKWLEYKERDSRKPNTLRSYQDTVRLYIKPHIGRLKLEKLRPLDVEHLLSRMLKDGKSAAMASYTLRVLKMGLKQAVGWGMLPRNVADTVRAPKVERKEMQVWTPEEVAAFLGASQLHRMHAAFYLALMTGMRRGEILGLQWTDIDWERSRLKIRHNLVEVRVEGFEGKEHAGKATVSAVDVRLETPKTEGSRRTIILSPGTLAKLKEHQANQELERKAAGSAWQKPGFVFASELGGHIDPRTFYGWYLQLVKTAKVPRIRLHDMRHTAASLMIRRGVPPKTVSERLGHADVAFTLRVYTHLYDDQKEEAAFDLADLFPVTGGQN